MTIPIRILVSLVVILLAYLVPYFVLGVCVAAIVLVVMGVNYSSRIERIDEYTDADDDGTERKYDVKTEKEWVNGVLTKCKRSVVTKD